MKTPVSDFPGTVDEAVDRLLFDLSLNHEIQLSTMNVDDLIDVHCSLGHYIRNSFGLWAGNEALMESCRLISRNQRLHVDDASMVIIKALRERLKAKSILTDS